MCGKDSCDKLRLQILSVAPDDHPWKVGNGFTEIRMHPNKPSKTVEALQKSCDFHLKGIPRDATDAANKTYAVAHIHWPVAIFKLRSQRSRLINAAVAKQFDKAAGYTARFFDDRNKVGEKYVQAPVCPQAEVKAEIQSMTSLRAKRTEENLVKFHAASRENLVKFHAASRLQSAWRSSVARSCVKKMRELFEEAMRVMKSRAVVRLQSAWRYSVIRMQVKSRAVVRLQSALRSSVLRMRVESRAVVRLQSAWRLRVKSRVAIRLQFAWRFSVLRMRAESRSAVLLQSVWRPFVKRLRAVLCLQSVWRSCASRSRLERMQANSRAVVPVCSPDIHHNLQEFKDYHLWFLRVR
jgi:hypothetical protein